MLAVAVVGPSVALGADAKITIQATVDRKHGTVRGTLALETEKSVSFVDPLARLPEAPDDLNLFRTYPGAPEQGLVRWTEFEDGKYSFYAILPRRYGDIGAIRRYGLFANGGWYPQPMVRGRVAEVEWEVSVTATGGEQVALGDVLVQGQASWSGTAERVSLAVVPRGRATAIAEDGLTVSLLTRGKPRRRLTRELRTQLLATRPAGMWWKGTVVQAPLRRRLSRSGVGLAYVSDRAFRVGPGMHRFHRVAVTRRTAQSFLDIEDPYLRELAGAVLSARHSRSLAGADARRVVRAFQWLPAIDAILNDRRMPFWGDIFESTHPTDPVRDDLVEALDPHTPGTVIVAQLEDAFGVKAVDDLGKALLEGGSLADASALSGIPEARIEAYRSPYPIQDIELSVERDPTVVRVLRNAPGDAPPETVVITLNDQRIPWNTTAGSDVFELSLPDTPNRVAVDPQRHTAQTSRLGDRWPSTYRLTAEGWISGIHITQRYANAYITSWIRGTYDTHNLVIGTLFTRQDTLVGARATYLRKEGRLQDGLSRPHRFTAWVGPSVLNRAFADTDGAWLAVGAGLGYTWDSRVDYYFPLRGHRIRVSGDGGLMPGTERWWAKGEVGFTGLVSPHPRHVLAMRGNIGIARGDVPHRLLGLGGEGALRSLPGNAVIGERRGTVAGEYRVAVLRNASVPLGIVWGQELQIALGGEVGALFTDGKWVSAAGATVGVSAMADTWGADPFMVGVTMAWPMWGHGVEVEPDWRKPQVLLRWGQAF